MKKNRFDKWLIIFLVVMVGMTFISRKTSEVTTPKVSVSATKPDSIRKSMKGYGTIANKDALYVPVEEQVRVQKVYANQGSEVKKNKPLFQYDLTSLKEKLVQQKIEMQGLEEEVKQLSGTILTTKKEQLALLQQKVTHLQKLVDANGIVKSPVKGVVLVQEVIEGKRTEGNEICSISKGQIVLTAKIEESVAKDLNVDDSIHVQYHLDQQAIETKITHIGNVEEDEMVTIEAVLPNDHYLIGASCPYFIDEDCGSYSNCLPLEALCMEDSETFVLTINEREGILGTEYVAKKQPVTVTAQSDTKFAIEEDLGEKVQVIVGYSKVVHQGDVVILNEKSKE